MSALKALSNMVASTLNNMSASATVHHNRSMIKKISGLREDGITIHNQAAMRITQVIENTENWMAEGNENRKEIFLKEYDILQDLIADYIPSKKEEVPQS